MENVHPYYATLPTETLALIRTLDTPIKVQKFLVKEIAYNFEPDGVETCRNLLQVLQHRVAHCFEGALFAASVLMYHGYPPLIVHMDAERGDINHNLFVYWRGDKVGSIGQSRDENLRGREPIYPSLRELMLAYHPFYYHYYTQRKDDLTLAGFSMPIDLRFFGINWVTGNDLFPIYNFLDKPPFVRLDNGKIYFPQE